MGTNGHKSLLGRAKVRLATNPAHPNPALQSQI
jgi:hypothetical protein